MKVIILKKCKDGNVNDVVEVSNGYGTNFLIKNGFAAPYSDANVSQLNKRLEIQKEQHLELRNQALKLKDELDKVVLTFKLKVTNSVIHGHVTNKKILLSLKELGFKIDKYAINHVEIASLGITKVPVNLYDKIIANISIEVLSE